MGSDELIWVNMGGASQKDTPRDSTKTYSPRGITFRDVPR